MDPEKNIEEILSRTRVPDLPLELKEQVMGAARVPEKRGAGLIFRIAAWTAAACILITVCLQVSAGIKEEEILEQLNGGSHASDITEQEKLYKEFGIVCVKVKHKPENMSGFEQRAGSLKGVYNGE